MFISKFFALIISVVVTVVGGMATLLVIVVVTISGIFSQPARVTPTPTSTPVVSPTSTRVLTPTSTLVATPSLTSTRLPSPTPVSATTPIPTTPGTVDAVYTTTVGITVVMQPIPPLLGQRPGNDDRHDDNNGRQNSSLGNRRCGCDDHRYDSHYNR